MSLTNVRGLHVTPAINQHNGILPQVGAVRLQWFPGMDYSNPDHEFQIRRNRLQPIL